MVLRAYLFHLRARNLSPRTIKATEEYLRLFFAACDPLTADKRTIENYLAELLEAIAQKLLDEQAWLLELQATTTEPPSPPEPTQSGDA